MSVGVEGNVKDGGDTYIQGRISAQGGAPRSSFTGIKDHIQVHIPPFSFYIVRTGAARGAHHHSTSLKMLSQSSASPPISEEPQ